MSAFDLDGESRRWVTEGIIDDAQRERIVSLYPERAAEEGSLSLVVLGILWIGGALVFLGLAFLLAIIYEDLPVFVRVPILLLVDGFFFATGLGATAFFGACLADTTLFAAACFRSASTFLAALARAATSALKAFAFAAAAALRSASTFLAALARAATSALKAFS